MASKLRLRLPLRVVGGQVAVTVVAAALALIWGADAAKAVFAGGAVAFLPNALFALAFERAGEEPAQAASLLGLWVGKLGLTVALLALAVGVANLGGGAFFVGLGAALAAPLAVPILGWADERGEATAPGQRTTGDRTT